MIEVYVIEHASGPQDGVWIAVAASERDAQAYVARNPAMRAMGVRIRYAELVDPSARAPK